MAVYQLPVELKKAYDLVRREILYDKTDALGILMYFITLTKMLT